jgi:RecB family exonuclease
VDKTGRLSPSHLDSYSQCPFQFFAARTLRLKEPPSRPVERLDFAVQGNIVHAVLAEWCASGSDLAPIFQRIFEETCEQKRILPGYHTERLRNAILEDLERFAADATWPRELFQSQAEQKFEFALAEGIAISGRIDRIDSAADGRAYIIDYKYSGAQGVKAKKNDIPLQAPLYVMAAEKVFGVKPAGMFFVGLKGAVKYVGWSDTALAGSDPLPENWQDSTHDAVMRMVAEIRQGRMAPCPADSDRCRYCDARDICRIEARQPAAAAEGA